MTCSICNSEKTRLKFNFTESLQIIVCEHCGVEFLNPQLSDEEIIALYSENYYKAWGVSGELENESARNMKLATSLLRLKLIQRYRSSGKLLDVGCATGYFPEAAKTLGYNAYGVELSEYSSGIAKTKLGADHVFNGKLEESNFPAAMFDVITMFDLIEHVRSPIETLKKAAQLMTHDGVIIITTPNNKSNSNRLMGKKWTHYKKEHFFYFDLKSLNYSAEQAGLHVVYSEHSKKALNLKYLHTQFNVYKHRVFTPVLNVFNWLLPKSLLARNFYIGIGELTVVLKKKI